MIKERNPEVKTEYEALESEFDVIYNSMPFEDFVAEQGFSMEELEELAESVEVE